MTYTCSKCGRDNLLSDEMAWNGGRVKCCKICKNKYNNEYRNTPTGKLFVKNMNFKRKYGLTIQEFEDRKAAQNNCCLICDKSFSKVKAVIDHDHKTNQVRGILCYGCNTALGLLNENESLIFKVLDYLKKWSEVKKVI